MEQPRKSFCCILYISTNTQLSKCVKKSMTQQRKIYAKRIHNLFQAANARDIPTILD